MRRVASSAKAVLLLAKLIEGLFSVLYIFLAAGVFLWLPAWTPLYLGLFPFALQMSLHKSWLYLTASLPTIAACSSGSLQEVFRSSIRLLEFYYF